MAGPCSQRVAMDDRTSHLFAKRGMFVIGGPCVIESAEHAVQIGRAVAEAAGTAGVAAVFKASFDKANRTSRSSYRGLGLQRGLEVLRDVRRETGLPVLTDIHEPGQAAEVADVCDILQIPAFLCRQTDLLVAAGRAGRVVNIKKGQFMAPEDMQYAADKVASHGNRRILLTERGTSFGYRDLVVDFRSSAKMSALGYPVVLDVTHSLQQPGAAGGASGGQPEFIELLARAGAAAGFDALFLEVHEDPGRALSDGATALRLDLLPELLVRAAKIWRLVSSFDSRRGSAEL